MKGISISSVSQSLHTAIHVFVNGAHKLIEFDFVIVQLDLPLNAAVF